MNKLSENNIFTRLFFRTLETNSSFYYWKTLQLARSIDEHSEQKLEENCQVLTNHSNYFAFSKIALIGKVIIDLDLFFDTSTKKGRNNYSQLMKQSERLSTKVKKQIKNICINSNSALKKITKLRNNEFAHLNINEAEEKVLISEVEQIFDEVQKIFIILAPYFASELEIKNEWEECKENAVCEANYLLRSLHLGDIEHDRQMFNIY